MLNRSTIIPWFIRDGRLRSGWRISAYLLASLLSIVLLGLGFGLVVGFFMASRGLLPVQIDALFKDFAERPFHYPDVALVFIVVRAVVALGLIWACRKWIDKRSFVSLGLQMTEGWRRQLGAGFAFVMVGWCAIFLLSLTFGAATVVGFSWDTRDFVAILGLLFLGLVFNFFVGLVEESDARGYILQNLGEGIGFVPAVLVSSLYFGALHLLNPGAGWLSTLGIFFAGILLALGYYATHRLWFSIGMHAAWNFAEGSVFGFPVSGLDMGGLFYLRIDGPEWLMGGKFGPEAGVLAVIVEIAMIGILFYWMHSHKASQALSRVRLYLRSVLK